MYPSNVSTFPSHRAQPPHTHGEAEQEARGHLWGSLITRATPSPAGKRVSACPEGTCNVGDTDEPPSHPGKGCHSCAGTEPRSRAHCVNPALPELFSWISLEMELGSHPAAAGVLGSSWKLEQLQAHSSGSPSASRARAGRRGASDLPPCSLYWPQCLMPSTCQGRGRGLVPSSLFTWPCWSHFGDALDPGAPAGWHCLSRPWTGTEDRTCSPHTNMGEVFPGQCPSPGCSSVLLSPSCPQRMAL